MSFFRTSIGVQLTAILGLLTMTLGGFFLFGWFSLWSIFVLLILLAATVIFGRSLWVLALILPLVLPIGFIGKVLVGRSYVYEITAAETALLALTIITLFAIAWGIIEFPRYSQLEFLLGLFVMLSVVSVFWIDDAQKYLVAVRVAAYHFLSLFLASVWLGEKRRREWAARMLPFLVAAISIQLLSVLARLGSVRQILLVRQEIETPVGAVAFVVATIALLLPLVAAQGYRVGGIERWWTWGAFALGIAAVVASIGKAAMLAMVASIGYFFWKIGKGRMYCKRLAILFAILILFSGGGVGAPALILERFGNIISDVSTSSRIEEASAGLLVARRHPMIGVGAGNLKYQYERLLGGYSADSNVLLVQVAAEYGIIGLLLLLSIVAAIRDTIRRLDRSLVGRSDRLLLVGIKGALVSAALYSFVEVTFVGLLYGIVFWWMMGWVVAWQQESR